MEYLKIDKGIVFMFIKIKREIFMIKVQITNLKPSDIEYLKSALGDPKIQETMLSQLSTALKGEDVCMQSLDNIFCAAAHLNMCYFVAQVGVDNLDTVFNDEATNAGKMNAFVEGLGSAYSGKIKLQPEQRKFTR